MALQIVNAPNGGSWSVWTVTPGLGGMLGRSVQVRPELAEGWLAFHLGSELRRMTPMPRGWEQLPDSELVELWEIAEQVPDAERR